MGVEAQQIGLPVADVPARGVEDSATSWVDAIRGDIDHAERLERDLPYFAERCLKLRPKTGGMTAFAFNPAQLELHRRLEEQKAKTGKVRAVVLKARQMGISTYIAARFYKRTIHNPGLRTIIIAHEKPASNNLFKLVKRFNDNMPDELRPSVGISNAQELIFDKIDSGYGVSVATEDGAGRSDTSQMLHASEASRWVSMGEQLAALLQTVPRIDGSEIVIETTGNEFGDEFHQFWRATEAGENEFIGVFLPWTLDPAYRAKPPQDFRRTDEEAALADLHGLDDEQLYWRRLKVSEMRDEDRFKSEYPLTSDEAFLASHFDSFIGRELVMNARKQKIVGEGPLVIGVDPAGKGADATAIAWRRGSCIAKIAKHRGLSTMEVAGLVAKIIREDKPDKVSIDVGGLGVGVADRLEEQGYKINRVNFGGKPVEPPTFDESGRPGGGPLNRRAEMWGNLKNVLEGGRFAIPDSDSLMADLCSVGYRYDSAGRLVLESKEDLRKRGMPSPDEGDAVALCFTEPGGVVFHRAAHQYQEPDLDWVV